VCVCAREGLQSVAGELRKVLEMLALRSMVSLHQWKREPSKFKAPAPSR